MRFCRTTERLVRVADWVAVPRRTTKFQGVHPAALVHVERPGTLRLRAANAVWVYRPSGVQIPDPPQVEGPSPAPRGRAFLIFRGVVVAVLVATATSFPTGARPYDSCMGRSLGERAGHRMRAHRRPSPSREIKHLPRGHGTTRQDRPQAVQRNPSLAAPVLSATGCAGTNHLPQHLGQGLGIDGWAPQALARGAGLTPAVHSHPQRQTGLGTGPSTRCRCRAAPPAPRGRRAGPAAVRA